MAWWKASPRPRNWPAGRATSWGNQGWFSGGDSPTAEPESGAGEALLWLI